MRELPGAIQSLWLTTRDFMKDNPHLVLSSNKTIMPWLLDDFGEYNYCHMWSNFEIVDLKFLRSEAYQSYFKFLDRRGGFFYERYVQHASNNKHTSALTSIASFRWSDAPVRTLAAAMFLPRHKIHFFNSIGYTHSVASHCPVNRDYEHCSCDVFDSFGKCEKTAHTCHLGLINWFCNRL